MRPDVELLVVGDELQSGRVTDTNSTFLGRRLFEAGLPVVRRTVVGDDPAAIAGALGEALGRAGLVFVVGGLGPTPDDRTFEAVAAATGRRLTEHQPTLRQIEARFRRAGRRVPALSRRQARVPTGARLFANPVGMVPGTLLEHRGASLVILPGVPAELEALYDAIEPELRQRFRARAAGRARIRVAVVPESALAPVVERVLRRHPGVMSAYYPSTTGVDVVLSAGAARRLGRAAAAVRRAIGGSVFEVGDRDLAEVVGGLARARRLVLSTAESCTGGMVAARLTDVPGSSEWFAGGVVAYSNAAKSALLGVSEATLARHGAVSRPTARQMALGACRRFGTSVGIAVSGIAGPGGGSPAKPVGLVFVAAAVRGRARGERFLFAGPRRSVRERATAAALDLCRRALEAGS
ncbi:MAG: CinA family nicotinamide mononucleotide deamidase-related protein [bacterium]